MRDAQAERRLAGRGRGGGEEGVAVVVETAAAAACCQARSGRSAGPGRRGQAVGSFRERRYSGRRRLAAAPDGSGVGHGHVGDHALGLVAGQRAPQLPDARGEDVRLRAGVARADRGERERRPVVAQLEVVRILREAVVELDADRAREERRPVRLQCPCGPRVARDDLQVARDPPGGGGGGGGGGGSAPGDEGVPPPGGRVVAAPTRRAWRSARARSSAPACRRASPAGPCPCTRACGTCASPARPRGSPPASSTRSADSSAARRTRPLA